LSKNFSLKTILNYSLIKYISLALGLFKGVILAGALGPTLLGSYSLIILVVSYTRYINLGFFSAVNLKLSVLNNLDSIELEKNEFIRSAFSYLILLSTLFTFLGILFAYFLVPLFPPDIKSYIWFLIPLSIAIQAKLFQSFFYRLNSNYKKINHLELITNILLFIGIFFFADHYKLTGIIIVSVIVSFLTILYGIPLYKKIRLNFNLKLFMTLIRTGIPLLTYGLCDQLFTTIDRVFIANSLTREHLGYYSFANTIALSTFVFIDSLSYLFYPKFLNKFNRKNMDSMNNQEQTNLIFEYSKMFEVVTIFLVTIGLLCINPFIYFLLPKYDLSINIYIILLLAFSLKKISYFSSIFLISNGLQPKLIKIFLLTFPFSLLFNYLALYYQYGNIGVAIATLGSMFIFSLLTVIYSLRELNDLNLISVFNYFKHTIILIILVLVTVIIYKKSVLYVLLIYLCTHLILTISIYKKRKIFS
jgi:O-antigen/teichoic acid export membrane protein